MARKSVKLMTEKLLNTKEVFERIDAAKVAELLEDRIPEVLSSILDQIGEQEEPDAWKKMPAFVKEELLEKAKEQAAPAIKDMMEEVKENIDHVFDLEHMVVESLVRDPGLLNHMFIECGSDELRFIRDCGAIMGGVAGVVQMGLWIVYSKGWMLPAFGLVVGLASNWIALKMIFEPVDPVRFCGMEFQGLFLKRQKEVSECYGKIVAYFVLSSRHLLPAILRGPSSDKLYEVMKKHVHATCDQYTGLATPFLQWKLGSERYTMCKAQVAEKVISATETMLQPLEKFIDECLDLEKTLTVKMGELPPKDFDNLLHPVFQEDEWKLILMGGVLGVVVGFGQWHFLGG